VHLYTFWEKYFSRADKETGRKCWISNEFEETAKTTNLNILAIIRRLESIDNYQSKRKAKDGTEWIEPNQTIFYLGYYGGSIWFIGGESCGIQMFTVEELEDEIKKHPDEFTEDIKYILKKWKHIIKPIEVEEKIQND